MDADRVEDAVRRGAGRVGRALGDWCEAFRPDAADEPLAPKRRFLRLQAMFAPPGEGLKAPGYGAAAWWGSFDSAYTRVGDYIRRPPSRPGAEDATVWFIASQEKLLPALCIRTDRTVDILRPAGGAAPGVGDYGGATRSDAEAVARRWPVSLLMSTGGGLRGSRLPAEVPAASWHMLMPAIPTVTPRRGDLIADGTERIGVVSAAERSALGWRLLVRETVA